MWTLKTSVQCLYENNLFFCPTTCSTLSGLGWFCFGKVRKHLKKLSLTLHLILLLIFRPLCPPGVCCSHSRPHWTRCQCPVEGSLRRHAARSRGSIWKLFWRRQLAWAQYEHCSAGDPPAGGTKDCRCHYSRPWISLQNHKKLMESQGIKTGCCSDDLQWTCWRCILMSEKTIHKVYCLCMTGLIATSEIFVHCFCKTKEMTEGREV